MERVGMTVDEVAALRDALKPFSGRIVRTA
jgi:hypothetical protein